VLAFTQRSRRQMNIGPAAVLAPDRR